MSGRLSTAEDQAFRLARTGLVLRGMAVAWLLVGIITWCQYLVFFTRDGRHFPSPGRLAVYCALRALLWMGMTWTVFAFIDRSAVRGESRVRRLLLLIPFLTVVDLVEITINARLMQWAAFWPIRNYWHSLTTLLWMDFHEGLLWLFTMFAAGEGTRAYFVSRAAQRREAERERALVRAQLETLTSRLQPHFLFNALHGISALLAVDPAAADRMIGGVGGFLRTVVEEGKSELVTLEREMQFVDDYLAIQRLRFGERVRVSITYAPEAAQFLVPNFVLQPLVENAVKHGIERMSGPSAIAVDAIAGGGRLVLSVRNTAPVAGRAASGTGTGLATTRQRLELLFPKQATLRLHEEDGMMVTILEMPATTIG
jgi:two-component system, LytTR family, sensor kinase